MMNISETISLMNNDQLWEIGKMIHDENPDHLKHKSKHGTNVILNKLSEEIIKNIWEFIQAKLTI